MVRYAHLLIALLAVASFLQAQTATETPSAPLTKAQIKEQLALKQVQIQELQRQIDELRKQQAQDTSQTTTPITPAQVATAPVQVTPAPLFEPKTLTVSEPSAPTPAAVQQIGLGQTPSEVHALIGMPTIKLDTLYTAEQWAISHVEQWTISLHDAVSVRFDDGKVAWIGHFDPNPWQHNTGDSASPALSPSKGPSKWERFSAAMDKVANVAGQVSLGQVCPTLYRKPMIFMTANDLQWLQACNSNGYMFFGLYVYTGGQ